MKEQYVVLLRKNLDSNCSDISKWLLKPYSHWISLGHFDEIFVYEVDANENLFASIQAEKRIISDHSDASAYYHPLFLVSSRNKVNEKEKNYWFIAVVRIHFSSSQGLTTQFDKLSELIAQELDSKNIAYRIHHTTEFSDMVLDVRATRFCDLLNAVLKLRKYAEVGKAYSYFGINAEFLHASTLLPDTNDKIPMISMRFTGENLSMVMQQIEIIRQEWKHECEYSINGVDDIMLLYKNLPSAALVSTYRKWMHKTITPAESITRVGVQVDIQQEFASTPESDLSSLCKKLTPLRDDILTRLHQKQGYYEDDWFRAISEVSNTLVRMSKSPVMDEVVYLVAPQIEAFLENVLYHLDNNTLPRKELPVYYRYVESCTHLMEQLMRAEGQLSQRPEIRPAIYDIPVFMLEYTVAFLVKVSELLKMNDSHPNRPHVFFLVPCPCSHISSVELFRATPKLPGLVQLQVPEKSLYSPTKILRELCHEISHYVGERYRNRAERKKYYSRASAVILSDAVFLSKEKSLTYFFEKRFLNELKCSPEPTIQEMRSRIHSVVTSSFASDNNVAVTIRNYLKSSPNAKRISFPSRDTIARGIQRFYGRSEDLDILFREIYADVCMLYILDMQPDDYIESLLIELDKDVNPLLISNYIFSIRIFVSLTATRKKWAYGGNRYRDLWVTIRTQIAHINEEIFNETDGKYKTPIPIGAVFALLEYANECYNTISTMVKPKDTIEAREMVLCLSRKNLDYRTIIKRVEECRAEMI